MHKIRTPALLTLLIAFYSLTAQQIPNLGQAKKIVQAYYEDGRFDHDVKSTVDAAIDYFSSRVLCTKSSAVVFDIDDTLLWSYHDIKNIGFGYVPALFHEWVMKADSPEVPHVKRLYDFFVSRGCAIILLSGRRADEREATIKNLKKRGFTTIDKLITRSDDERDLSARAYKTAYRKLLEQQGYDIVATIGDQESDLQGGHACYQVKIPNYTYIID